MKSGIAPVPESLPEDVRDVLNQMRNILIAIQGGRANVPASSIAGLSSLVGALSNAASGSASGGVIEPDLTPPPPVSGVVIAQSPLAILIKTDNPNWLQGGGQRLTRVYGAQYSGIGPLPTFANAVVVCEFVGQIGAFDSSSTAQWRLWLTWLSNDGVESPTPAGGVNGLAATAQAVDDSMVINLSAAKLNVGDGTVGGNLRSANQSAGATGWLLTPAGYFEANNGLFRGQLNVQSAVSGERMSITNSAIRVYDAAGVVRVKLGNLA